MRRLGYSEHINRESGERSFTRRLRGDFYPRYHVYIDERHGGMTVKLHLDQKKPSYAGAHAHSGEYEGPLIEKEIERIKSFVFQMRP